MKDYTKVNTLVECEVKTLKDDEGEKINSSTFNNLVGSLRYLTCTHPYILFWSKDCEHVYEDTNHDIFQNFEVNFLVYQRY
jgi:hypothetical protein